MNNSYAQYSEDNISEEYQSNNNQVLDKSIYKKQNLDKK